MSPNPHPEGLGAQRQRIELTHGGSFTLGSVECVFVGDYVQEEAPAPAYAAPTRTMSSGGGYGDTPLERGARIGFGPKPKPKSNGYAPLIVLGCVALGACGYAAWTFTQMTAP